MDERLRGNYNYSKEEIISFSNLKKEFLKLDDMLNEDYILEYVIINSKAEGWGINYRVGKNSLCYIHPEKNSLFIAFQIKEEKIEKIKNKLSDYALNVWDNRYPCGKGGWMWYRLTNFTQLEELKLLFNHKIKPNKK